MSPLWHCKECTTFLISTDHCCVLYISQNADYILLSIYLRAVAYILPSSATCSHYCAPLTCWHHAKTNAVPPYPRYCYAMGQYIHVESWAHMSLSCHGLSPLLTSWSWNSLPRVGWLYRQFLLNGVHVHCHWQWLQLHPSSQARGTKPAVRIEQLRLPGDFGTCNACPRIAMG
jgi:hypothetical protein